MTCQNPGPIHLGISEEACENAGGKWFRTPCITLKEAIDARPFKYNISNPVPGICQDGLLPVNTAYVEASTHNTNFAFTSDAHGCNEFCRSLPDYTKQIAMMTAQLHVRKVRVEIAEEQFLSLTEVEVYDHANINRALNKTASQSSDWSANMPASLAVNGIFDDYTHTRKEAGK